MSATNPVQKKTLQNKWLLFLLSIRISEKALKFDNVVVNKKEFNKSKQTIDLDLVNVDQIVISDKFKHSDDWFLNILLVTKKMKVFNRYALS